MSFKNRKLQAAIFTFVAVVLWAGSAQAIMIFEYGINIDGTKTYVGDPLPGNVDASDFDFITGLGNIDLTFIDAGSHYVSLFVDHDIDADINTFWNETGATSGSAAAGQSWEIDEPGYVDGDIFINFQDGTLDNSIGTSVFGDTTFPDDVSMAIGWDFTVVDTTTVSFVMDEIAPSDFYLSQTDPDSNVSFYFSSSLASDDDPIAVPEPGTLLLVGLGLIGLVGTRRRASAA